MMDTRQGSTRGNICGASASARRARSRADRRKRDELLQARRLRDVGERVAIKCTEKRAVGVVERVFQKTGAGKRAKLRCAVDNRTGGLRRVQNFGKGDRLCWTGEAQAAPAALAGDKEAL